MGKLLSPKVSEKAMSEQALGKYVFVVRCDANKNEIIKEIKDLYKVDATKVNILNYKGKEKLVRGKLAKKSGCKKVIVTLKKGQKMPGFEEK